MFENKFESKHSCNLQAMFSKLLVVLALLAIVVCTEGVDDDDNSSWYEAITRPIELNSYEGYDDDNSGIMVMRLNPSSLDNNIHVW